MSSQTGRSLMIGIPLLVFALDFILLLITYLALAPIAPDVLGAVAVSPVRFAAWIALLQLPMALAHLLAVSWRGWVALLVGNEISDPPVRDGWRRALIGVRDWTAHAAWWVLAALIVFHQVADPGSAHLWLLVALTAAGPLLVPRSVSGSARLLRRWWRRRQHRTAYEA